MAERRFPLRKPKLKGPLGTMSRNISSTGLVYRFSRGIIVRRRRLGLKEDIREEVGVSLEDEASRWSG